MFPCLERRYPDNEVRVAVFIDPTGPFDYGYHDISKGQKLKILGDIDNDLWFQLCDDWPCPSRLRTTRYGSCWYFIFLTYFSISLCGLPYAVLTTSPLYAGIFWSIYMAWTIGVFYSLKVVKSKMIKDFGPATRDHINSLARRFETEAGYIVDYGVDGSFAYARFQKIDRSDFEHVTSTESHLWIGLACLIAMFRYLVVVMLFAVLLFCPLGILLLSELGTSGLQQRIESSPMHQDLNYPQVRFSQWSYFNPQYPQATRIIFSPEQRTSLGMSESDSMVLKMVPARIAALAYTWFLFCGLNLYLRSGTTLHQQQKSTWFIGAAALSSCLLAVLALFPILELFEKSPICGPHYVELPFERRYASDNDDHYRYYGTTSILRDDIDASCELGKDAYWQSGLGAANLIFLFLWFCRQRFYIRKQNLLALTEANLKYYCHDDIEDCDLDEIQTVKQANHSREELERSKTFIFTDTSSDDDSTVEDDDPSRKQIV